MRCRHIICLSSISTILGVGNGIRHWKSSGWEWDGVSARGLGGMKGRWRRGEICTRTEGKEKEVDDEMRPLILDTLKGRGGAPRGASMKFRDSSLVFHPSYLSASLTTHHEPPYLLHCIWTSDTNGTRTIEAVNLLFHCVADNMFLIDSSIFSQSSVYDALHLGLSA
jgi:hypothetical protein